MNIFFRVIAIFICSVFYSQDLSIAYEMNFRPDKNNIEKYEVDVCMLDISNGESFFYSPLFNNEGKRLEIFGEDESLKSKILNSLKTTYIIKKNLTENEMVHFLKLDEVYAYEDKFQFDWDIDANSGDIEVIGYKCKKATTKFRGRTYTAFFTSEIPVNDGPYKFYGLPGLILKVISDDGDYSFKAIGIEKSLTKLNLNLKKSVLTSRKKYLKMMKQLSKDPSKNQKIRDANNDQDYKTYIGGKEVSLEEKYKFYNKMIFDFMKGHNNPIEKDDIWIR